MLVWLLLTLQVASSSFLDLNSNIFYVGDADNVMVSGGGSLAGIIATIVNRGKWLGSLAKFFVLCFCSLFWP